MDSGLAGKSAKPTCQRPGMTPRGTYDAARLSVLAGERGQSLHHPGVGVAQRIQHGEMIGAGDLLVTRSRAALCPCLRNDPALAQKFAGFQAADNRIERLLLGGGQNRGETAVISVSFNRRSSVMAVCSSGVRSNSPEIE